MLVLKRNKDQNGIYLIGRGEPIKLYVDSIGGGVKVSIEAPREIKVLREEVYERDQAKKS